MSAKRDKMNDIIEALIYTGMSKNMARVLAFLISKEDWVTSKDIEEATKMCQSDIWTVIQGLIFKGWVERGTLNKEMRVRGHPPNIYRMSVNLDKVYFAIENDEKSKIHGVEDNLKDLREMWSLG